MTLCLLFCSKTQAPQPSPQALRTLWLRCSFDHLEENTNAVELEAALRRSVRTDRFHFAVRWGQCARVLSEAPPSLRPLAAAWDAFLPVAQRTELDAIELDRSVRQIGVAWRATEHP